MLSRPPPPQAGTAARAPGAKPAAADGGGALLLMDIGRAGPSGYLPRRVCIRARETILLSHPPRIRWARYPGPVSCDSDRCCRRPMNKAPAMVGRRGPGCRAARAAAVRSGAPPAEPLRTPLEGPLSPLPRSPSCGPARPPAWSAPCPTPSSSPQPCKDESMAGGSGGGGGGGADRAVARAGRSCLPGMGGADAGGPGDRRMPSTPRVCVEARLPLHLKFH
jgi:hypothetical protein